MIEDQVMLLRTCVKCNKEQLNIIYNFPDKKWTNRCRECRNEYSRSPKSKIKRRIWANKYQSDNKEDLSNKSEPDANKYSAKGETYEGYFNNDKKNGKGLLIIGECYFSGSWKQDQKDGVFIVRVGHGADFKSFKYVYANDILMLKQRFTDVIGEHDDFEIL